MMDISKILFVVTGTGRFAKDNLPTGLWLSELTHVYHSAESRKYEITLASPKGGNVPVDPESLKPIVLDKLSRDYWENPEFRDTLQRSKSLEEVSRQRFDCIYMAGGHGAMYDFPDNTVLQTLIKEHYEANKPVAAICHGVCALLNVKLSDGKYLITDKRVTGFPWFEESLAGRKKEVPFNLEAALKKRGARYEKYWFPLIPKVVTDGNLITGQDPFSSKKMAETVMRRLSGQK